jgi:MFS family permease
VSTSPARRLRLRNQALAASRRTFSALRIPNYRHYFLGQAISLVGTWMQAVAQSWLVLTMTGSGTAVGGVVALQTLPVLLLGPYGGVIADRVDKRRLMIGLQSMMGLLALALGILTLTGAVQLWQVYLLAVLLGLNNTFENPARQSFILEMVGPADLRNAISLNSVLVNAARAVGPAVAGILIATVGTSICFLLNAASFIAVVTSLATMNRDALDPSPPATRGRGQLREGLRYVARTRALAVPLIMMGLIGTFAYEFQVVLPLAAKQTFASGSEGYGVMTAAMGVGAVAGGLVTASIGRTGLRPLVGSASAFGLVILAAALAPTLAVELVSLAFVGAGSMAFLAMGNSTLQLAAAPTMRGRVMALWAVAFLGSTPVGGPTVGYIAEHAGPRWALAVGALSCFTAAGVGLLAAQDGG